MRADGTWEMVYQQFEYGWNTLCAQIRDPFLTITYASYCSAFRVLPSDLELLIFSPYDGAVVGPTVAIDAYVNYESTIRVYVDGSGPTVLSGVSGPFTYDGGYIADGTYTTSFVATDLYGRTATASVTFTVDATPPIAPTVTEPSPKRVITTKQFTVTGTAEPLTHIEIRSATGDLTGRTDVGADGTWTYTFTDHELAPYYSGRRTSFTFIVVGYDDAINYSAERSYTYTLKIGALIGLNRRTTVAAGVRPPLAGAGRRAPRRPRYSATISSVSSATDVSAVGRSNVIRPCWRMFTRSHTWSACA